MNKRLDRRLVAVMFTDMVGYTALMQADERLGLDKRDRYMGALESHHDAFGGTIVQRLGDGSMSVGVVGLGRFRLKNVGRPFELYAVSADGVVVPDPEALEGKGERFASLPSNLPDPATPIVGRSADLASLVALVREHRVVTITGPGGVGKTRIVIELGRLLAPEFLDGVAFIALADVTEPADFLPALADALDVKEAEGRTLGDGIVSLIGDKTALLLLDNLEQVVAAASDVASLVEQCPELRIVTTSRTPLRIAAEREHPLAPLELPPASDTDSIRSRRIRPSLCSSSEQGRREARSS